MYGFLKQLVCVFNVMSATKFPRRLVHQIVRQNDTGFTVSQCYAGNF